MTAAFLAINPQYSQTYLLVDVAYLVDKYSSKEGILVSSSCLRIFWLKSLIIFIKVSLLEIKAWYSVLIETSISLGIEPTLAGSKII